jgi:hypothetical protein
LGAFGNSSLLWHGTNLVEFIEDPYKFCSLGSILQHDI